MHPPRRIAVLIDAENANASSIAAIMAIVATHGRATIKRAYGDWTTPQLGPWKKVLSQFAIRPCQQFRHARAKNASDCALIMDAMEILHAGLADAFCIVSSDSDYTGLAGRIQEAGLIVYGFGVGQTTQAFRAACDVFVLTDALKLEAGSNCGISRCLSGNHPELQTQIRSL